MPAGSTPKGAVVAYDLTVCRSGPETRPMQVVVTHVPTTAPMPAHPAYCHTGYSSLNSDVFDDIELPAGCATVRFETNKIGRYPSGHIYRGCLIVDQRCQVTESDERNNVACTRARFPR